ncbi:MAG: hypothetical protein ACW96U_00065 [Candidatus Heimdallarchaeaceae archaeon]|jgi:hypothetical protein
MSDVKDVKADHEKEAVVAEDNVRLEEVVRGYRVLLFKEDHFLSRRFNIESIRIYDKSVLALSKYGDELFTRTRNRLMKDEEMLTYSEQMEILKGRNLWDDAKEAELLELREKARDIQEDRDKILSKISDPEEKGTTGLRKEEKKLMDFYKELYIKYAEMTNMNLMYFQDTIEMQAQFAQQKGWICTCICFNVDDKGKELPDKYDPDKRLWKNIKELENDLRDQNLEALIHECIMFWNFSGSGGDSFFAGSPEELISESDGELQKK